MHQGPIIFVSLAQATTGEIDVTYTPFSRPGYAVDDTNSVGGKIFSFLNYTQVTELYGKEYNLAPRAVYY